MKILNPPDSAIFSKLGRNSFEELEKHQTWLNAELQFYQNLLSDISQDENTFSCSFKNKMAQWRNCLTNGISHEQIDMLSHKTSHDQRVSDYFDELLASVNCSRHWLPVSNGRNKNIQAMVSNTSDHLTIVCEVRDGYASIFVSPQAGIIWESKKIDNELTFNILEYNDLVEVLGCQIDLTPTFLRSHGHFYSNDPFIFKNTVNSYRLPVAIPYLADPEVVYMNLAWDALEIFLPFREGFLTRRLPSFGLGNWLHREIPSVHRLYGLTDEILKFVLIREQSWHGGVSGPEVYPNDLTDILENYCTNIIALFKDYPFKIHLSGWFGSSLFHNLLSRFYLCRFELPPKGCITTWHNILFPEKQANL